MFDRIKRRVEYHNALTNTIYALKAVQENVNSKDNIKALIEVQKMLPFLIRYQMYMDNTNAPKTEL